MHLAGYPLSWLLGVFGVAALGATVLYILKLRRRPVPVVFSPIWRRVLGDRESSRLFSQLKRWLSLLLQLALLALLALALGDPRRGSVSADARHVVVLVDASASMLASDVAPSRLDAAREAARGFISGLGSNDRMLLAQLDTNVTPLSTMTDDVGALELALEQLRASDTRADLGRGLGFALDSLRAKSHPEIIVISDGAFPEAVTRHAPALDGVQLSFVPIGSASQNVAITAFSVRRYPLDRSRYEVMLEVFNTNAEPAEVELSMYGDGQIVQTGHLSLAAHERRAQFFPNLAGADRTLEATIELPPGQDHLSRDNRAYALMPERRRTRVLVVTPGNTYLEAALLLDEFLDVSAVAPGQPLPDGRFDVTILDGVTVAPEPRLGGLFYLNLPASGGPVGHRRPIQDFGFDRWDEKSGILRWIAPENIQVTQGAALAPEPRDQIVGSSELGPILVAGRRNGQPFVALGFDPRHSDIVLRVAWPLFVLNTINHFVEEDTGYISSFRTGDVWQIPAAGSGELGYITEPGGARYKVAIKDGRAAYAGIRAGFYELAVEGSDRPPTRFAANLSDLDESQIAPAAKLSLGGSEAGAAQGFAGRARHQIWGWLVLAVVLISAVEWLTYHRRITV
jgi:VWA domain-containing protein/aerotolerance regulator-like protein